MGWNTQVPGNQRAHIFGIVSNRSTEKVCVQMRAKPASRNFQGSSILKFRERNREDDKTV